MSEYRRQIAIGSALAVIVALGLGLGIVYFPQQPSSTESTTSVTSGLIPVPAVLLGYLSGQNASCSLATGACTFTIVNNSTVPLQLESCQVEVIQSINGSATTYGLVNGAISGPATVSVPANSQAEATCTIPVAQLSHETEGSFADVGFSVKLLDSWYSYPAGTEAGSGAEGTWS